MSPTSYKLTSHEILRILKKYTDEDHHLSQKEIGNLLEQETGKAHARKSIHRDLAQLVTAGYPIVNHKGWYYEHEFCPAELNMIIDSLRTSSGITANQRDDLIRKVSLLGGDWFAKDENNEQLRPFNPQFLYALDVLHEAIASGRKVKFFYGNYGTDKQLHYRYRDDGNPRDYLINPYQILTTNGRYYLICNVDKYDTIAHFRVERIMDIETTDLPIKPVETIEGCENGIDVQHYVNDHPFMYSGQTQKYNLRIKTEGINDILDWFGTNVEFVSEDENETEIVIESDPISYDLWIGRYAKHIIESTIEDEDTV